MTKNYDKELRKILKTSASANQICEALHISPQELSLRLSMLKFKGLKTLNKRCLYSGDIIYSVSQEKIVKEEKNKIKVYMEDKQVFDVLVLSDLHLCSERERVDILDNAFEYCAKNGIHIILIAGDLIDGLNHYNKDRFKNDPYKMFEYFAKFYPFDANIITIAIGGNHDITSLLKRNAEFFAYLNKRRYDIITLGYGLGVVEVHNESIYLYHPIQQNEHVLNVDDGIILRGHSHQSLTYDNSRPNEIKLPTCSNILTNNAFPSGVRMQCYFDNGYIDEILFKQILFLNNAYEASTLKLKPTYRKDK